MREAKRRELARRAKRALANGGPVWGVRAIAAAFDLTPRQVRHMFKHGLNGGNESGEGSQQ